MAETTDKAAPTWPKPEERRLIGQRISRLDGPAKVTGAAKYTYDLNRPGLLYARVLRCPHAHAKVTKLDLSAAQSLPGVRAVRVIQGAGSEIQWALDEVAVVAATSDEIAQDALRAIAVEYEVLPHFVSEEKPEQAPALKAGEEQTVGDPEAALAAAAVRSKGTYGMPVISHNCLEPHGQICEWTGKEEMTAWCSTQAVSAVAGQFAERINIPAANVHVITQYMGGGFGSKFSADRWGIECAELARQAGAPVKLMLDRAAELTVAGDRPSAFAEIEVGAKADGTLTAWVSKSWGSGGLGSSGDPPLPYVFQIPNRRQRHTSVPTNTASSRAWRAPNHPQGCFLTMSALDDLAAKLGMDPYELFVKNLPLTGDKPAPIYKQELEIAERLMGWKARWHPRGAGGAGPIKRGLGLSIHTWGGRGHRSNCEITLHPDGQVELKMSTQDLGTGTRTAVGIVCADTLGLPLEAVKVSIGDSRYPSSGGSGGSTTIGGVSAATFRAALNARTMIFEKAAPKLGATPDQLEAAESTIRVKGTPDRRLTWKQAVALFGRVPVTATGANPGPGELTSSGVGGVQMAEVTVDVETGIVKMQKMVAVQDCGLVIDLKTAESQVYGALIMGISGALSEEKVIDPVTGRMLNVDFESYKMAGIGDVGELVVHMMTGPGYDERGPIGLGEPPMVSPGAAIANAVANAVGVRVPWLPLTPRRVLDALYPAGGKGVA
jgi:xanthine dehydrogenase YagR molybdenum-binding subunit